MRKNEKNNNKIKKKSDDEGMNIPLKRTKDILKTLGEIKRADKNNKIIVGFSMETENLIENSRKKLSSKNANMICANSLKTEGAGYQVDTNIVTIITADDMVELPLMSKDEVADHIFNEILKLNV